jgi:hypothetical protein
MTRLLEDIGGRDKGWPLRVTVSCPKLSIPAVPRKSV